MYLPCRLGNLRGIRITRASGVHTSSVVTVNNSFKYRFLHPTESGSGGSCRLGVSLRGSCSSSFCRVQVGDDYCTEGMVPVPPSQTSNSLSLRTSTVHFLPGAAQVARGFCYALRNPRSLFIFASSGWLASRREATCYITLGSSSALNFSVQWASGFCV